tara:strand:+ start:9795 stop:11099 length:1305 start_codon:yes stop_codon:yes gene_type:complete
MAQGGGFPNPLGASDTNFTNGFNAVLKDFFEGTVRDHLNTKVTLLSYIEKSKRSFVGRKVVFPVNLRRTSGVGARGEYDALPAADRQRYDDVNISAKYLYGRIELTGPVIEASRGDRGAFASALRSEVEGMRRDLRDDLNRQLFGQLPVKASDGAALSVTGALGVIKTGVNNATQTLDSGNGKAGTRYIKAGMKVSILAADGTHKGSQTVNSVASSTAQFTMAGAVNTATDDVVVRGDSASSHSLDAELNGIANIVQAQASGSFLGISTTDFPEWAASELAGPGGGATRPLSLELMQLAVDTADEVGGSEPNLIMGHHSARREYINLLTSDVRYAPEQLRGGFQKLSYAGGTNPIPIEFDKHCTYNALYFVNTADVKYYVQKDWAWANRDGSMMSRVSDKDAWEAFMCFYGELGCERRNTHVILKDLAVSNTIF